MEEQDRMSCERGAAAVLPSHHQVEQPTQRRRRREPPDNLNVGVTPPTESL